MRFRGRIIAGLVAGLMTTSTAAYACVCCPWTEAMGCQARGPSHSSCAYPAAVGGDIDGRGAWHVQVRRGAQTFDYASRTASLTSYPGAIEPGDLVSATAGDGACVTAGQNTGEMPC